MLPENLEGAIFGLSLKIYDRVYLVVAAALIVRVFLVLSGSRVDRWAGIAADAMGCIAIWWTPYYPIWSLTYSALVIYPLAVYGGNAEAA